MVTKPNNWPEEDREEIVEEIIDGIVSGMTLEEIRNIVWDFFYEEFMAKQWPDIWDAAETYAPELLERFQDAVSRESSH